MSKQEKSLAREFYWVLIETLFLPAASVVGILLGAMKLAVGLWVKNQELIGEGGGLLGAGVIGFGIYLIRRRLFYRRQMSSGDAGES